MWGLIALAASIAISWVSFGAARRFVRERLRYVDAALKPAAAVIAGVLALVIAAPIASFLHWLPIVGWFVPGGAALIFGVSVGLGVRSGANDVKRGYVLGPGN